MSQKYISSFFIIFSFKERIKRVCFCLCFSTPLFVLNCSYVFDFCLIRLNCLEILFVNSNDSNKLFELFELVMNMFVNFPDKNPNYFTQSRHSPGIISFPIFHHKRAIANLLFLTLPEEPICTPPIGFTFAVVSHLRETGMVRAKVEVPESHSHAGIS